MMPKPTVDEIRAFVGKKSDYYRSSWRSYLADEEREDRFNMAAFFFAMLWLPYRKMYKTTMLFYGFIVVEIALEVILFNRILQYEETPIIMSFIVNIIIGLVCGVFGSRWYYLHTFKNILNVRRLYTSQESRTQALIKSGGTSWLSAIGITLLMTVVIGAVIVLLE